MRVCPYTLWRFRFYVSFANSDINLSVVTPPPQIQLSVNFTQPLFSDSAPSPRKSTPVISKQTYANTTYQRLLLGVCFSLPVCFYLAVLFALRPQLSLARFPNLAVKAKLKIGWVERESPEPSSECTHRPFFKAVSWVIQIAKPNTEVAAGVVKRGWEFTSHVGESATKPRQQRRIYIVQTIVSFRRNLIHVIK